MPSSHFPNSAMRTTQHLLLLLCFQPLCLRLPLPPPPNPFRSHCLYERSHSSARSRTWTPGPAHHFLAASVARPAVSVHTPSQLVSHLVERFRITSPRLPPEFLLSLTIPPAGPQPPTTRRHHTFNFQPAESSLHLTLLFTLWKQTPPP